MEGAWFCCRPFYTVVGVPHLDQHFLPPFRFPVGAPGLTQQIRREAGVDGVPYRRPCCGPG